MFPRRQDSDGKVATEMIYGPYNDKLFPYHGYYYKKVRTKDFAAFIISPQYAYLLEIPNSPAISTKPYSFLSILLH